MKPQPSPSATSLATAIAVELFGKNHVRDEDVQSIARVVDPWLAAQKDGEE